MSDHGDTTRQHRDITTWRAAIDDLLDLLATLDEDDWARPTDLPGWRVHDVVAHLAHLESVLAGHDQQRVEVRPAPHIRGQLGRFTEEGVLARADHSRKDLIEELAAAVRERAEHLQRHPVTDPLARSDGFGAVMGWNWATLLANRVLDVWMHDQDIRRAVDRPGGFDTPAAAHTATMIAATLPVVFAKRAGAPVGATLVLDATGPEGRVVMVEVGPDGRASGIEQEPDDPTVRLTMSLEDWLILAGGRRTPDAVTVRVEGDADLGGRVLHAMAVAP